MAAAGGLDLAILGLGVDGHVAYNMPGPVSLPTHVARLPDGLASHLQVPPASWPLRALTMGIGTIRGARAILVMATGAAKAAAVRALVRGPENPDWPCSFLQPHPDIELILDAPAAAALPRRLSTQRPRRARLGRRDRTEEEGRAYPERPTCRKWLVGCVACQRRGRKGRAEAAEDRQRGRARRVAFGAGPSIRIWSGLARRIG